MLWKLVSRLAAIDEKYLQNLIFLVYRVMETVSEWWSITVTQVAKLVVGCRTRSTSVQLLENRSWNKKKYRRIEPGQVFNRLADVPVCFAPFVDIDPVEHNTTSFK